MEGVKKLLHEHFSTISLKEMDSVKLMDRTDTKYVFKFGQLPSILAQLKEEYKVLQVEGTPISKYETLYYDTLDFDLYHKHQTRRINRHKIRSRSYTDSGISFLEVKLKNSKGRTIKTRIKIDEIKQQLSREGAQGQFLTAETGYDSAKFYPQFWVNYHRITLVSLVNKERCTIDLNLQFLNNERVVDYSFLVILELKQEKATGSLIAKIMKDMQIREGGLSKYCLGVISHNPEVKHNNFKQELLRINKLKSNAIIS